MADQESVPDLKEQRQQAVARLKRAASLPRMRDGRRPPMHVDGVSEGERANTDEENKPDLDTPPPEEKNNEEPVSQDTEDAASTPTATRSRRRSRSRSRSRGSKDLKGKNRNLQSPTPSPLNLGDSSQDESTVSVALLPMMSPSPVPSLQQSRFLRSPTPTGPDFSMLPYPASPPTPLPSLETLSKNLNLFRSNSAGRMMAMHKLTGGTESYEPSLSPSPTPPLPGKFRRTNTVSGGERNAARAKMFTALERRAQKDTDGEQGSGGEEPIAPSPSPTHKRRRRRSRRSSSTPNAMAGLSDSDFVSTSHNTPQVPPTPLPALELPPDLFLNRDRSVTPNRLPSRSHTPEQKNPSPAPTPPEHPVEPERADPPRRRSILIEEEEDDRQVLIQQAYLPNSPTPPVPPGLGLPTGPSHVSTDSEDTSVIGVPVYLSSRNASRQDVYPPNPFTTPLKEKSELVVDEDERVIYRGDTYGSGSNYRDTYDDRISWVASPVPEIRMPVDDDEGDLEDDEDDYEDERPLSPRSSAGFSPPEGVEHSSPRDSTDSQNILIESETSPDIMPAHVPPSPSSIIALSHKPSVTRSYDSQVFPARLSVALPASNAEATDLEDRPSGELSGKRNGDSASTSAWEKVKSTFTRSNSSNGRRSRSNSIVTRERRDHTDSSVSRESGASLTSGGKTDKVETSSTFAMQQGQIPLMQTQSASASYVSLAPTPGSRGGVSPVPPPSSSDLAKYQNEKLFPFPGIKKLEEQRNRAKGFLPGSSSTPDVNALVNGYEDEQPPHSANSFTSAPSPFIARDRTLSHQASDSGLLTRYNMGSPPISATPSTSSHPEYIDIIPQTAQTANSSIKLPMTLPGVKQWLSNKKLFSGQNTSPTSPPPISPPLPPDGRNGLKKPSLSDLLRRKDSDLTADWDEFQGTPTSASGSTVTQVKYPPPVQDPPSTPLRSPVEVHVTSSKTEYFDLDRTPRKRPLQGAPGYIESDVSPPLHSPNVPSPPDVLSSTTPDPSSSLSDYPAPTSDSSSTSSSNYSSRAGNHGSLVLERLEENLARGSRSPMWASAIENTPRKLSMCISTLQVVNPNTVKDRFLFLFSDILIVAKPQMQMGQEDVRSAAEKKFTVKSVVLLRNLRFSSSRSEPPSRTPGTPRNPLIRTFILQFCKNPDQAISTLISKTSAPDDPAFIGQVLFKTFELDRVVLGEFLSRRSQRSVLKSYVDNFGFVGVRVDDALRIFLLSLHIPTKNSLSNGLEYLLDSFAGRWYEANAGIVAYDRDLAIRLVRVIVQLNDLIHGGIAEEPGQTMYPKHVACRDFVAAFRKYDSRKLVSDELLEDIYTSIRQERLSQASADPMVTDTPITVKRPAPLRLTYKVQSDPIIFRIPQPDPQFRIHLSGQDLVFDPPVLTFQRSSEASFRVMGTSLGAKSMIFRKAGANALKYDGIPFSTPLTIERAFMRNTFQIAFTNHLGTKRRYMFSVDDPIQCHTFVSSLKRNIDICLANSTSSMSSTSPGLSKFHRATEVMAFRTLQETLLGIDCAESTLQKALRRLSNSSPSPRGKPGNGNALNGNGGARFGATYHSRSKSRSQVYHRGAGQHEPELNGKDDSGDSNESGSRSDTAASLWTGQEIEMQCLQNSSIALVLSYLQVGVDHPFIGS